jgi:TolA-binding protein
VKMDLEQYMEREIIIFLDSKIQKKDNVTMDREEEYGLYLTKDYLKELTNALDNDELTKAKKLFDELKSNYSKLPKRSTERKKIYTILEQMFEKIQNYIRIKEGRVEVRTVKQSTDGTFKDQTVSFKDLTNSLGNVSEEKTNEEDELVETNKTVMPIVIRLEEKPAEISREYKEEVMATNKAEPSEQWKSIPEPEAPAGMGKYAVSKKKDIKGSVEENAIEQMKPVEETNVVEEYHKKKDTHKRLHEKTEIPQKVMTKQYGFEDRKHKHLEEIKNEIIDKTAGHLEKLKMHVTDKLLSELHKKLDEKNTEHNNRIDRLRKEIIQEMTKELNKRFKLERHNTDQKLESLRKDILKQVYNQAGQMISSSDNQPNVIEENNKHENMTDNQQNITVTEEDYEDNHHESNTDNVDRERVPYEDDSKKKLKVIYEQAVYYMFDSKYNEAAKLFREIIESHPNNRAARIRLQECIEKQPETRERSTIPEIIETNKDAIRTGQENESTEIDHRWLVKTAESENSLNFDNGMTEFKDAISENVQNLSYNVEENQSQDEETSQTLESGQEKNEEKIHKMYEEAIYTMFQNKYGEAAKIFTEILRIKPENKAAKIRLQECIEKQPKIRKESITLENSEASTDILKQEAEFTNSGSELPRALPKLALGPEDEASGFKDTTTTDENIPDMSYTIEGNQNISEEMPRSPRSIYGKSEERIRKMYEEAIYTMFQNNYGDAAKIFTEILRISPENKAAKIRLHECIEAINNA